jgi:hypothetical protein
MSGFATWLVRVFLHLMSMPQLQNWAQCAKAMALVLFHRATQLPIDPRAVAARRQRAEKPNRLRDRSCAAGGHRRGREGRARRHRRRRADMRPAGPHGVRNTRRVRERRTASSEVVRYISRLAGAGCRSRTRDLLIIKLRIERAIGKVFVFSPKVRKLRSARSSSASRSTGQTTSETERQIGEIGDVFTPLRRAAEQARRGGADRARSRQACARSFLSGTTLCRRSPASGVFRSLRSRPLLEPRENISPPCSLSLAGGVNVC